MFLPIVPEPGSSRRLARALMPLLLVLAIGAAWAQKPDKADTDRAKPMVIEADKPGIVDLQRQIVTFSGNVVISQGTMTIRAERVEVRETSDGYRVAQASGGAGRPASYRQRREGSRGGADEAVEGEAERIDYDQKADTLRFAGNAQVRRLRGGVIADEINGNEITWNAQAETLNVQGGAATPANPGGRVRVVLSPRESAASAAKPAPAPAAPLKPSTTLGPAK